MKAALPIGALALGLAACAPATSPTLTAPAPAVRPAAIPAPAPVRPSAVQAPGADRWMDGPATPGDWRYQINSGGPVAVFIGPQGRGEFVLSCDRARGTIGFWRAGTSASARIMTIRAETATSSFQVVQAEDTNPYLAASIPATDPLLDAMALSKGRFAVEVDGQPPLTLPAWAEVTRVIEDCR